MIDVTNIDKVAFAKAVYAISAPKRLGFIHARHGPLTDHEAQDIAKHPAFFMDHVHGRACKMFIHKEPDGRFTIGDSWHDHTDEQFDQLLKQFGLSRSEQQHGAGCECSDKDGLR